MSPSSFAYIDSFIWWLILQKSNIFIQVHDFMTPFVYLVSQSSTETAKNTMQKSGLWVIIDTDSPIAMNMEIVHNWDVFYLAKISLIVSRLKST